MSKWIRFSDKLPEKGQEIIVDDYTAKFMYANDSRVHVCVDHMMNRFDVRFPLKGSKWKSTEIEESING